MRSKKSEMGARGMTRKHQGGADDTKAIRRQAKEIRYLNAIMHNKYRRNPEKLRGWGRATHLERAPERKKKDEAPPSTLSNFRGGEVAAGVTN